MIGLALLAPLSSFAEENGANKKKPNIIYILADDLGISELGCARITAGKIIFIACVWFFISKLVHIMLYPFFRCL